MTKQKRQSDGRYRKSIWTGDYKDGKKVYKQIVAWSKEELDAKVNLYLDRLSGKDTSEAESQLTLYEYACAWLQSHKAIRADNTKAMYENVIKTHLRAFDGIILREMTPTDALRIINQQSGHTATQQKIALTLKQIIKQAVRDEELSAKKGDDILASIPKIRHVAKEKRPLTESEILALKTAAYKYPTDEAFVLLIYGCGLRREEALALTTNDFDWKKGTVRIDKALALINGSNALKAPKTALSTRTLPIPPTITKKLKYALSESHSHIFVTSEGALMTNSAYRRMWERIIRALKDTGYEIGNDLTAHVFRHNYVTQLCYQIPSISLKKVSQLVGDREDTILKIYNHILAEREDVGEALSAF